MSPDFLTLFSHKETARDIEIDGDIETARDVAIDGHIETARGRETAREVATYKERKKKERKIEVEKRRWGREGNRERERNRASR